jgi:hypothetical protein
MNATDMIVETMVNTMVKSTMIGDGTQQQVCKCLGVCDELRGRA